MGQFSWLDCLTGNQIINGRKKKVYVLIPEEFGGGHLVEDCYDGYGNFGDKDAYALVAEWNREWLKKNPNELIYTGAGGYKKACEFYWFKAYTDLNKSIEDVVKELRKDNKWFDLRTIGIDISCYDENKYELPYPLKITYNPSCKYEDIDDFSLSDPNQGWRVNEFGFYEDGEEEENVDLGCFSVDVEMQPEGLFDVYVRRENSTGEHYYDVTADEIGENIANFIRKIANEQ